MPFEIKVKRAVPRGDDIVRRRALVIGLDYEEDPELHLPYCVTDAKRMAGVLANRGYAVTAMHAATGPDRPTRDNVRRALRDLLEASDEDDTIVVYFAGHGKLIRNRSYFLMADTPNTDPGIVSRGLRLCELLGALRKKPRFVAVFLDACHMGLGLSPLLGRSIHHNARRDGSFALLSGSALLDVTQDKDRVGGIFSASLIDALDGPAADPDGSVWFSVLAHHVQRGVAKWRNSDEGRAKLSTQYPVLRLEVADLEIFPPA
jgi:uncharacterized caspase-like protein